MRTLCAASAAIVVCLALGGAPVVAQDEPEPAGAVWVTGTGSDPRVSGTGTGTWNQDWYPGGIGISWRTYRLENEGGAWSSAFTSADGTPRVASGFLEGEGGYEGLTVYWHLDVADEIRIVGIIFPGDPPKP